MKLTKGERLYIARKRLKLSQVDFATRYGVSHDTLSKVEKGNREPGYGLTVRGRLAPTKGELITLLRRRLGLTQEELALQFGFSKLTMIMRERGRGDVDVVLAYLQAWQRRKNGPRR